MSKFDYSMSSLDERAPLFGPTGISPPTHRGLLGPGIGDSQSHRGRKRVGIVCLVLVIFLQGFNINPGKIRFSLAHFLHFENKQFRHDFEGLTVIAAVLLYFLPMVVGLYADTYAGRYKALFLGIGLKLTGSILGFILLLVFEAEHAKGGAGAESVHIMSQSAIKALFAIFIVSNVFTMVGFVVILPSMLSFAAQQLEPTFYGISSFVRWTALVTAIGVTASNILWKLSNRPDVLPMTYDYYETILYAIEFGCDALSIAIFLFGKIQYTIVSTEEGETSWKEVVRMVKTYICRSKPPMLQGDDFYRSIISGEREQTLDKLNIRKAVLFVVLISCFALAITLPGVLDFVFDTFERQVEIRQASWARNCKNIGLILGAPVMEIVFRKYGGQLKPDTTANQLRTIAVGTALGVTAITAGGIVIAVSPSDSATTVNACLLIPPFIIMGFSGFIIYTSTTILCYLVSPRGLGTFLCTVLLCLSVLMFVIEGIIQKLIDLTKDARLEIACFSVAGVMAVVFLVIFYPVSRLYLRTEKSINDFLEPDDLDEATSIKLTESLQESREISRD